MTTTNSLSDFSIDLRSDTVTRPTSEMRAEMTRAITGDDVFAEDPEINALQDKCAEMFSMESGLYCPSGTMTNQIAISVHTSPGDEVICSSYSHIYNYEGGGVAKLSGASVKLLDGARGMFTSADVEAAINPNDSHYAQTSLVCLEDTCNKGGGAIWDVEEIKNVSKTARSAGLAVHLDGARLWNAIVARGVQHDSTALKSYASNFDSISICLSKGLGCPVGSVLLGSKSFIAEAHRVRKVLGGGMRQAGVVAIAGTYAINNHLDRLAQDHTHARALGEAAVQHPNVKSHAPIDTNIVILELEDGFDAVEQVELWSKKGIKCFPFSKTSIRFVTHLDNTYSEVEEACRILKTN